MVVYKAKNAWCGARAVDADTKVKISQQLGHGGSLIKELRLPKVKFLNHPYPIPLARIKPLYPVTEKLQWWAGILHNIRVKLQDIEHGMDTGALPVITEAPPSYREQFVHDKKTVPVHQ